MFVKTVCECQKTYYARAKGLINVKLKIENGKLWSGRQFAMRKHIMPERNIAIVYTIPC